MPDRDDPVQVRSTAVGDDLFEAVGKRLRQLGPPDRRERS
jgi:hypothetical protein